MIIIKLKYNFVDLKKSSYKKSIGGQCFFDGNKDKIKKYQESIEDKLQSINTQRLEEKPDHRWKKIKEICQSAAKQCFPVITPRRDDPIISELSTKQKKLKEKITGSNNRRSRKRFKKERNKILHRIQVRKNILKQEELNRDIDEFNSTGSKQSRLHETMKKVFKAKNEDLLIKDSEDQIVCQEEATEIITQYYENIFFISGRESLGANEGTQIDKPYSSEEVKQAVSQLGRNRSSDVSGLKAEHFKNAPEVIYKEIAGILNNSIISGDFPSDLNTGLLVPLHKPGKVKGKVESTRPVIILPILRKITAKCLINRIYDRINNEIPVSQAAYRKGRSTIEHIFTIKILADKALTSQNYGILVTMLDMSKAFDMVSRKDLFNILQKILMKEELYLMKALLNDVQYSVKNGKFIGKEFSTNTGVPQGDCLSAVLFTLYLAKTLNDEEVNDHNYAGIRNIYEQDHSYSIYQKISDKFLIEQQYADDIAYISNCASSINAKVDEATSRIQNRYLKINSDKTEKISISRDSDDSWMNTKYLGCHLDCRTDFYRRKALVFCTFNKFKKVLRQRKIHLEVRLNLFNSYVKPVFMYGSELWTMNKDLEDKIDKLHRYFLRQILGIFYPIIITNAQIYQITKERKWTQEIRKSRLRWTGHLLRLPQDTPARLALDQIKKPSKKPRGRSKKTWIDTINEDLKNCGLQNIFDKETEVKARDRNFWRHIVHTCA